MSTPINEEGGHPCGDRYRDDEGRCHRCGWEHEKEMHRVANNTTVALIFEQFWAQVALCALLEVLACEGETDAVSALAWLETLVLP